MAFLSNRVEALLAETMAANADIGGVGNKIAVNIEVLFCICGFFRIVFCNARHAKAKTISF